MNIKELLTSLVTIILLTLLFVLIVNNKPFAARLLAVILNKTFTKLFLWIQFVRVRFS